MNFIDKILSSIGLARKAQSQIPLLEGVGVDPFSIWFGSKKASAEKALSLYSGWVYACVRAIAEEVGRMEFKLFQVKDDGSSEEVLQHELLDLLSGVNPYQTGFELLFTTAAHLELTGNAYWLLDGVSQAGDLPTAVWYLNPKYMKPIKEDIPTFISGYKYAVGNKAQTFQPFQVLHFKYPDPTDPYEGMGTVQAILEWINSDNFASQVNLNYFKNGARLSGVLESENYTSPEQLDYIKKSFQQLYANAANAYQIAAMPKGTKYTPMSDTPKDMDFANLQTVMRDKILAGFRVSKTILGTAESDTNRATAETADYVFAARTIKPKMQLIVSYLNEFLVPRYGENLYLDFVDPVPENRLQDIQEMQAASGSAPILSPNELRERYFGAPPVEKGDSLLEPFNLAPLGAPKPAPAPVMPKAKTNGRAKPSTRYARAQEKRKSIASEIAKRATQALAELKEKSEEAKKKGVVDLTDAEYEAVYKVFASRVTPYLKALAEKIKEFNGVQKKVVLKNLPNAIKAKAVNPSDLFDRQTFVSALVDLSEPILTELYGKEGMAAADLIGAGSVDVLTPEVRAAIKRAMDLMSESYNDTTIEMLKAKLEEGISQGATLDELKDLVSGVYEFSDENRAEQVAQTETFRIANDATKQAWKQTEAVKSIKWYTAEDERVCPWCAPMQGKVVAIEDNFFNKGDAAASDDGKTMQLDYSDVGAPPLHPSCRCYIRPEEISLGAQNSETKEEKPLVEELVKAEVEKKTAGIKESAEKEIQAIKEKSEKEVEDLKKRLDEALN